MHRRSLEILGAARERWEELAATTSTPLLSAEDRRELGPILRAHAVQQVAQERSRWWWAYHALRIVTAAIVLAGPTIALLAWTGSSRLRWPALVAYGVFGGVLLLGHGVRQNRNVAPRVFLTAAPAGAFATLVAAALTARARYFWLWDGVALGLAAAVVLLVLAEARLLGLVTIRDSLFRRFAKRRAGWLLPPQLAAVHLLQLLDALHRARVTGRHPRWRRNFVRWMDQFIAYVQWDLPRSAADLRLGATVTADANARAGRLVGRLRHLQTRLANDHELDEYDRVSAELATMTMALARGDWSWSTAEDQAATGPGRVARVLKRLVPAVVLLAAALGLPYLPGVPSAAGLTGIQVGLALAAVLSLVPVDAVHRDSVISAYANATKHQS